MPNEFVEMVRQGQQILMCLCICSLIAIGLVTLFDRFGHVFHEVYQKWLHLDGVGRMILAVFVCGMWMYGSTKNVRWMERENAECDNDLGVVSICTMQTNIVSNAGATTNEVTAVQVKFTGNKVTINTPFWVRNSLSNEWTRVNWSNGIITSDLTTNVMECVTATNISKWVYWWLGENLPAVEIETIGITLLKVVESSTFMGFVFTCDNAKARYFSVEYQRGTNTTWDVAAQSEAALTNEVQVQGFWIGETRKWRITSNLGKTSEDGK